MKSFALHALLIIASAAVQLILTPQKPVGDGRIVSTTITVEEDKRQARLFNEWREANRAKVAAIQAKHAKVTK